MTVRIVVQQGTYHDSAFLMQVARKMQERPGIEEAVVLMGTPMNRDLLTQAGFDGSALADVGPMDLVVALRGEAEALEEAETEVGALLSGQGRSGAGERTKRRLRSLREAAEERPDAAVVSIAVPGEYAAHVAHDALDAGRHVFLFSDNVALEDEVALKERGRAAGLLVMGPDCGTSILSGVRFGFANRVPRGPVGIVGPSGTGIQEISCILANAGVGVSHAIGTGGRDMKEAVGGGMSEMALRMLAEDEDTQVVVLVAKSPGEAVTAHFDEVLDSLGKPAVVRYLGQVPRQGRPNVCYTATLDEAAVVAAERVGGHVQAGEGADISAVASEILAGREHIAGRLVGLFGGGSLAAEARLCLARHGLPSTVPDGPLDDSTVADGHLIIDVGEDFYTRGRPHPMVDQAARLELIEAVGRDPSVGLLLLDVVLGDGAHPDPAPELAEGIEALGESGPLVVCSVSGAPADPQGKQRQETTLAQAGVLVMPTAAGAATLAALLIAGQEGGRS